MNEYLKQVNSLPFYLITGGVLLFILIMCVVFLVKSYRAGIAIGMDKKVMRRAIMSSATFSVLPGVSILLGVIALSGSLDYHSPGYDSRNFKRHHLLHFRTEKISGQGTEKRKEK